MTLPPRSFRDKKFLLHLRERLLFKNHRACDLNISRNPRTVGDKQGLSGQVYTIPTNFQSFVHATPLQASNDDIYRRHQGDEALNPPRRPFIARHSLSIAEGLALLLVSYVFFVRGLGALDSFAPLWCTFGIGVLVLAVVLVHISMSLILFGDPLKILRIFFLGESQL